LTAFLFYHKNIKKTSSYELVFSSPEASSSLFASMIEALTITSSSHLIFVKITH
jgi:hypothetical protein